MSTNFPNDFNEYSARWEQDQRFFLVHLGRDLLGDWQLTQIWGTNGTSRGAQVRRRVLGSRQEAARVLTEIRQRREDTGDRLRHEQFS